MSKDRADIGNRWIRENYGERFKFAQEKQYESSIPMKLDKNRKCVNDVEEYMRNELKKKKETYNAQFENTGENMHLKESDSHSRNQNNSLDKSSKKRYEKCRQSSNNEIEISDDSYEESEGKSGKESKKDKTI